MRRYTHIFLSTVFLLFGGVSLFNLLIDPYAATGWLTIEGINMRKTRAHEDGRRVFVSHQILKRPEKSIIIGSSRVVDGFPETMPEWPGELYNAGVRGSNAYELAHIAALAKQKNDLRCIIVGMDVSEFSGGAKFKSAFLISRFPDGAAWSSLGRMMLSPYTLTRSIQTLWDNISDGSAKPIFSDVYDAGQQRRRFVHSIKGVMKSHQNLRLSEERIDYLFTALDKLASEGVQIIGYIHPVHAWYEEPSFRAGQYEVSLQLRKSLTHRFETLAKNYDPYSPCTAERDAVLWDFSGFQWPSTSSPPTKTQTKSHIYFHEPAHYLPRLGQMMIATMQGTATDKPPFGLQLKTNNVEITEKQLNARRAAYGATAEGQLLDQHLQGQKTQQNQISLQALTTVDWDRLETLLK